ncbi:acyltransferase domain-containing protein [Streptomyces yunnanensis]|uniref:Acyltransferase domain-containing protein n=2 Tax=Streptomyces yunnanensis TaxID=156453 RepID=A0ABY8APP7_9ACTN|nr:acyltransferase domain-containing protein [Streptomyces yunnanensis]WEB46116.1 acyltransferase domain-containing protein [Streptomyces yunnanensis]
MQHRPHPSRRRHRQRHQNDQGHAPRHPPPNPPHRRTHPPHRLGHHPPHPPHRNHPWPHTNHPRRAAISAFGISGTNAHLILEQAPAEETTATATEEPAPVPVVPWVLSGKTDKAVRDQAARLLSRVENDPSLDPIDIAFTLATKRTALDHRAAVIGRNRDELIANLCALASGEPVAGVVQGVPTDGKLAFAFTGQGAQRVGMGMELYHTYPAYAEAFDTVCTALDPYLDQPLHHTITTGHQLHNTAYTQPALFALEVALHHLLTTFNIHPDILVGHSIGELTAAHIAGILTLPDAARLVTARGHLMQTLPTGGTMIAIQATENDLTPHLTGHEHHLSIAAINDPTSLVISGDHHTAQHIAKTLQQQGHKTKRLTVSHAFHSPHMDPILNQFHAITQELTYHTPTIPIVSTLTGNLTTNELTNPQYWVDQLRNTVRYADALHTLTHHGTTTLLELGPDTTLTTHTRNTNPTINAHPTLRHNHPEPHTLTTTLTQLHTTGTTPNWHTLLPHTHHTDLPTYPFQHNRYWLEAGQQTTDAAAIGLTDTGHPLLGTAITLAETNETLFTTRLSLTTHPWLTHHTLSNTTTLTPATLTELAIRAGDHHGATTLDHLTLHTPLTLPPHQAIQLQVRITTPDHTNHHNLTIHTRPDNNDTPWTCHAHARLLTEECGDFDVDAWIAASTPSGDGSGAVIEAEVPVEDLAESLQDVSRFGIHPALLDAALLNHPFLPREGTLLLPTEWHGVRLHATGATTAHIRLTRTGDNTATALLTDQTGQPLLTIDNLTYHEIPHEQLVPAAGCGGGMQLPGPRGPVRRTAATTGSAAGAIASLADRLSGLSPQEQEQLTLHLIRTEVASVLGYRDSAAIDPDRAFQELGFDSLLAVELRNRLNAMAGVPLPATVIFEHPTPAALAGALLARVVPESSARPPLIAGLEQLEASLTDLTAGSWDELGLDHSAISVRLQTLLAKVREAADAADGPARATGAAGAAGAIESATAEEIFALIDSELGPPQ